MPVRHFARRGDIKRLFDADQTVESDWTFSGTVTFSGAASFATATFSDIVRITTAGDVSLSSITHGLQVGPTDAGNIAMDGNEIMARNNGTATTLHLNAEGGDVVVGGVSNAGSLVIGDGGTLQLQLNTIGVPSPITGVGQLWVRNTVPCQLWFTDDAGTDTRIV